MKYTEYFYLVFLSSHIFVLLPPSPPHDVELGEEKWTRQDLSSVERELKRELSLLFLFIIALSSCYQIGLSLNSIGVERVWLTMD